MYFSGISSWCLSWLNVDNWIFGFWNNCSSEYWAGTESLCVCGCLRHWQVNVDSVCMCVCWMLVECFDLCLLSDTADCRQLSAVAGWSLSAPLSQTLSAVCSVWHRLQSRRSRHRRLCCQYPCFVFTLRPLYELLSTVQCLYASVHGCSGKFRFGGTVSET